jgi:hypothetical protein
MQRKPIPKLSKIGPSKRELVQNLTLSRAPEKTTCETDADRDPRYTKPNSLLGRIIDGLLVRAFHVVNKCRPWHKIGKWPGVATLLALRIEPRRYNLFDTDADLSQPKKDNGKVCPFATGPVSLTVNGFSSYTFLVCKTVRSDSADPDWRTKCAHARRDETSSGQGIHRTER